MKHFDEMTAFLHLDGQLDRAQAAEVLAHAGECSECRALLRALEKESRWLAESLTEQEPIPARFAAPSSHASLPWGWMTALAFAAGGVLTVWNGFVEPFRQQLNQAGFTGGNLMTMLFFSGAFWKGWSSVLSFVEFSTVAVCAILAMVLLQRYWRRGATVGVVLAALALLFVAAQPASASDVFRATPSQPNYSLPAGQTVNNDLIVFAESTRIDGTVQGDLIAFSRTVEINGHVTGDVIVFGEQLRIPGKVDGNVRSACHYLSLGGTVSKNVTAIGGDLEIEPDGQISGGLMAFGGNIEMNGHVGRDLMALAGLISINGPISGNVKVRAGQLHIDSDARIQGSTEYTGDHPAVVEPGAKLGSPIQFTLHTHAPNYASARYYWHRALFWCAAFLFGLVLILLVPGLFAEGVRTSGKFLSALGFGALILVATPILAFLISLTRVGLGVGIAAILLYLIAFYAAQLFVGTWIGGALLGRSEGTGGMLGRLALGLLIIHALELVPYHVGWIVKLIVVLWGLGAMAIAMYRHLRPAAAAVTA